MKQKCRVLFVTPEMAPFAKSGELADVAQSLPKILSSLGIDIFLIMPKYRRPEIESLAMETVCPDLIVPLGDKKVKASVFKVERGKYSIFFIDSPKYFWREKIYGSSKGEYLDNDERFIFFNRAVLEFLLKARMFVDIIHCNNWPTALIPVFLRTHYAQKSQFKDVATVLTLHNVAYQGQFPPETMAFTGLNWNFFTPERLSFNGKFNFLKAGILFSDVINTVSSAYKKEIQTNQHGFGLEDILRKKKEVFFSIRNGIDCEAWNPEADPYIAANYSPVNLKGKSKCKLDLLKEFGLKRAASTPIVGIISYLSQQKGFDLILESLEEMVQWDIHLLILGEGDEKYVNKLADAQRKYPQKLAVRFEVNEALSHKLTAGADIFLIPSLHEPCGLHQLYSFRYGTVPVVRATGGLKETVRPFNSRFQEGNGFVFRKYSSQALLDALREALSYYHQPDLWQKIILAGMRKNFSWEIAAQKYIRLYERALELKRGGLIGE
ncbi:MAG: glycogen/starch synthase [Candidatus Aminicenantales bacterium]